MKKIEIKNKVVARGGGKEVKTSAATGADLSGVLMKSVWDEAFEVRTTAKGETFLFGKLPFALQYGFTIFANGEKLDLPSIFKGIPFDNRTIWMNPDTGLVEVLVQGTGGGTGEGGGFTSVNASGTGNAVTSFGVSADGKALTLVKGETFATQSAFLELRNIVREKADKGTTLSDYGIADAYTKKQTDNLLEGKWTEDSELIRQWNEAYENSHWHTNKSVLDEITATKVNRWDEAYGWGNHSTVGYLKNVTSLMVTSALGFTPYDARNPAGYVTASGSVAYAASSGSCTGNAKTATALQTARTLWGQSFDGTGNVSGNMAGVGNVIPASGGVHSLGSSSAEWSGLFTKEASISGIKIRKTASGVLFVEGDLVVKGGLTTYGRESVNVSTIMDGVRVDGTTIIKDGNVLKLSPNIQIGGSGGGELNLATLSWSGYSTGSYDGKNAKSFVIPNNTNQLVNGAGFVTASGSVNYATSAGSAIRDGNGNVIATSYFNSTGGTLNNNAAFYVKDTSGSAIEAFVFTDDNELLIGRGVKDERCDTYLYGDYTYIEGRRLYVDCDYVKIEAYDYYGTGVSGYVEICASEYVRFETDAVYGDYWLINNSSSNPGLKLIHDVDWYVQISRSGYMYVGAGSGNSMELDEDGNAYFPGTVESSSDIRKKTVISNIELSLQEVADAPLIEYFYSKNKDKKIHAGSVAQYWAGMNDWFTRMDEEGYYSLDIQNCALVCAVSVARELSRYENRTDDEVRLLKERIGELEKEVELLRKGA